MKQLPEVSAVRILEGAARYAAADASDPWAYARAVTHIRTGVASPYNADGDEAFYDAKATFHGWQNRIRP